MEHAEGFIAASPTTRSISPVDNTIEMVSDQHESNEGESTNTEGVQPRIVLSSQVPDPSDDTSSPTPSQIPQQLWPERPFRMNIQGAPNEHLWIQESEQILWKRNYHIGSYTANWRIEPNLSSIEARMKWIYNLIGFPSENLAVKFLDEGSYNKVYIVTTHTDSDPPVQRLLRIAKSVYPWYKTESEVATIIYVREKTTIPVPQVYAFESSSNNLIGYEWILMELMPGRRYEELIDHLEAVQQKRILETVHQYTQQMANITFHEIGSLYCDWDAPTPTFYIGRPVDWSFFYGNRCQYLAERGPFPTIKAYLSAYLDLKFVELADLGKRAQETFEYTERLIHQSADKDERELGDNARKAISADLELNAEARDDRDIKSGRNIRPGNKMETDVEVKTRDEEEWEPDWYLPSELERLKKLCEAYVRLINKSNLLDNVPLTTHPFHHDLHEGNILIDDTGRITAILDWEMIMALPKGLTGRPKVVAPVKNLTPAEIREILSARNTGETKIKHAGLIKKLANLMFWNGYDLDKEEEFVKTLEQRINFSG